MVKLTPFQKALLSSVSQEFSDVPQEEALADVIPISNFRPKRHFTLTLRRSLVAAAVVLVLAGVAFAAVRFSLTGQVEKSIYSISENGTENEKFAISFQQDIAAKDAPDHIAVYMLPSVLLSRAKLEPNFFFEDEDNCYYPLYHGAEQSRPLDGKVQTVHYEWNLEGTQVTFTQRTAKNIEAGKQVLNIHIPADKNIASDYETFVLGEYEIFCFRLDFSGFEEYTNEEYPMCRTWFWTDGCYLYELYCGIGISDEEMLEIFESVTPIEDINAYLGIEE